jgi:hypothetical protein
MTNRPAATNCETAQSNSADGLKLASIVPQDASPDTAVLLGRLETILNQILDCLGPSAGAQ